MQLWSGLQQEDLITPHDVQDGKEISPTERIRARQDWAASDAQLRSELQQEGVDLDAAAFAEDDSLADAEHIPETGCALAAAHIFSCSPDPQAASGQPV